MQPFRAILLKIASVTTFLLMASLIKATSTHVPPGEAVFFRSFFALPVTLIWLWSRKELRTGLKTSDPMKHVWRGLVGTLAMGLGFTGLGLLPLPEVTAIGYAAPLLTVIFAAMFLGEQVKLFRLSAVALGLVGVLIVLSPRLEAFSNSSMHSREALGAMVVLMGAGCAALAQVFIRKMVFTERTSAIVFYFTLTSTMLSLLTIPFGWVVPAPREAFLLILAGVFGGLGQILLTSSYRFADVSVIAPFEYVSIIFALGIGYFIFNEAPTLVMLIGASLVVAAGVLIIWREGQLGLERSKQRKVMTPHG